MAHVDKGSIETLTTSNAIRLLAAKTGMTIEDTENIIKEFINIITSRLQLGYAVKVLGIGTLYPDIINYSENSRFNMVTIKMEISKGLKDSVRDVAIRFKGLEKDKIRTIDL